MFWNELVDGAMASSATTSGSTQERRDDRGLQVVEALLLERGVILEPDAAAGVVRDVQAVEPHQVDDVAVVLVLDAAGGDDADARQRRQAGEELLHGSPRWCGRAAR